MTSCGTYLGKAKGPARKRESFHLVDRYDKPNSVSVSTGRSSIWDSHYSLPQATLHTQGVGTVLHRGKDLAVSAWYRYQDALQESLYPFGVERFCSHLAHYCGRALPATVLQPKLPVFGLSSRVRRLQRSSVPVLIHYTTNPPVNYSANPYGVGREMRSPTSHPCRYASHARVSSTNLTGTGG